MTLWGGRFDEERDEVLWRFSADPIDRRLLPDDVAGSLAHVRMLGATGILPEDEVQTLVSGLEEIAGEAAAGSFEFTATDEDVHTAVERRLGELVGSVAGKLHTGRSRNDQVCLDLRLYLARMARARIAQLEGLVWVLADQAEAVGDAVVPSYTHLQQAQAVPFAHHLLAYAWMLLRDAERFSAALERIEVSPLGAGASGGSSLPLDPAAVAASLGIAAVFENSMDAVGSRDFVAEYTFAATQAMVHLSRFAEELILWATDEFGWVEFADRHTTGSSALPHKKNPDIAELVRGRAGAVVGDLTAIMTVQKGLPLTYNRDLQEDKRLVFHADDVLAGSLEALTAMVAAARFDPVRPGDLVVALDVAEHLVAEGVPFREAHAVVGRLVARAAASGVPIQEMGEDLAAAVPGVAVTDFDRLDAAASIARRVSPGGGSMRSVAAQLTAIRDRIGGDA